MLQSLADSRFFWKMALNGSALIAMLMWFTGISFGAAAIVAVIFASTAYVVGDKIILRRTGNGIATLADMAMAYVFLWFVAWRSGLPYSQLELIVTVVVLGAVEFMYHRFLISYDKPEEIW